MTNKFYLNLNDKISFIKDGILQEGRITRIYCDTYMINEKFEIKKEDIDEQINNNETNI